MMYLLKTTQQAQEGIEKHIKHGNKKLAEKIFKLFNELTIHPRTGTGKPEQLKHKNQEIWSRRIDSKHRLVYQILDNELIVIAISTYSHYDNK